MPAKKKADKTTTLVPIQLRTIEFTVIGDAKLVENAWAKKARDQMYESQTGAAKKKKGKKNPFQDFLESLYWMRGLPHNTAKATEKTVAKYIKGERFGFPAIGFKKAAVAACRHVDGLPMVTARGCFHVLGDLIEIHSDDGPVMREDMVRLPTGSADIRHRGEFPTWRATLRVRYNKDAITEEQLVNLFNIAGFAVGIGENRPEKSGDSWGTFHVDTAA